MNINKKNAMEVAKWFGAAIFCTFILAAMTGGSHMENSQPLPHSESGN